MFSRKRRVRAVTEYVFRSRKLSRGRALAVVADLHDKRFDDIPGGCGEADALLIPGDLIHRYPSGTQRGLAFIREMSSRMPVYYTFGNHEDLCGEAFEEEARAAGATVLNNRFICDGELVIGGIRLFDEPRLFKRHDLREIGDGLAGEASRMLDAMDTEDGFRLLLCHNPSHHAMMIDGRGAELTVSGHAHGGQIRLFGRGMYAPHQGLLPALTRGVYGGGLLISAGASNASIIPRFGNPAEILLVRLLPFE